MAYIPERILPPERPKRKWVCTDWDGAKQEMTSLMTTLENPDITGLRKAMKEVQEKYQCKKSCKERRQERVGEE